MRKISIIAIDIGKYRWYYYMARTKRIKAIKRKLQLNEFIKTYTLRTSDFNCNKKLRPSSVLDLFQDAAGIHAKLLGSGFEDFKKKNIAWVITGIKYEIIKDIGMYSDLSVKTWPLKPSAVKFQRDFTVCFDGETVIKGSTMWSIIDFATRKISVQKNVYPEALDFKEEKSFDERFSKIILPEESTFTYKGSVKTVNSDIDVNGHVNNVKYPNFVTDLCGTEVENYKSFRIEYHRELLLGEVVDIYGAKRADSFFVYGKRGDNPLFTAEYSE